MLQERLTYLALISIKRAFLFVDLKSDLKHIPIEEVNWERETSKRTFATDLFVCSRLVEYKKIFVYLF